MRKRKHKKKKPKPSVEQERSKPMHDAEMRPSSPRIGESKRKEIIEQFVKPRRRVTPPPETQDGSMATLDILQDLLDTPDITPVRSTQKSTKKRSRKRVRSESPAIAQVVTDVQTKSTLKPAKLVFGRKKTKMRKVSKTIEESASEAITEKCVPQPKPKKTKLIFGRKRIEGLPSLWKSPTKVIEDVPGRQIVGIPSQEDSKKKKKKKDKQIKTEFSSSESLVETFTQRRRVGVLPTQKSRKMRTKTKKKKKKKKKSKDPFGDLL